MKLDSLNLRDLGYIIYRNVFLMTHAIIIAVVILLIAFGNVRAGIFLGIIVVINSSLGLIQDISAWRALQKLQLLTAPRVLRVKKDKTEELILVEQIKKGDVIKLKIGDQVPCDSRVLNAFNLEVNEGLITGESDSINKKDSDSLLAGSVITSGSSTIEIETPFTESRIARMTEGIKKYSTNASLIQKSSEKIIKVFSYILIISLAFVVTRGIILHESAVNVVLEIGTLTSILVPQGLVFAVTLFFAYGAANLFRKHVLLQEVNATEKLGRIKNLCMDKTGTITENILSVKDISVPDGVTKEEAQELSAGYLEGSGDSSQTVDAIKKFLTKSYGGTILKALPFSSWRQYGATLLKNSSGKGEVIFAGPAQIFLPHMEREEEKLWLEKLLAALATKGERSLCFFRASEETPLESLDQTKLSVVAVFVFHSDLRPGIRETIDFFQNRGVNIRIISGDNPETAAAVAAAAGVKNSDTVISGKELKLWNERDFETKVKSYAIFAGILPEQKRQIIEAFKKDGFTAMIGDGANDALAIKSADLGIAMFDGAPAIRSLASVVLTNNSFSALPGGVELADNIIRYLEMFSSMFLSQTFIGLLFFIITSIANISYPLTPFNVTLINYCVIGLPGALISYWVVRSPAKVRRASGGLFLKRVLPFAFASSVIQTIGVAAIFFLNQNFLKLAEPNTLVSFAFIIFGFSFFVFAPKVFQETVTRSQKVEILFLGMAEFLLLLAVFNIPWLTIFFTVATPNISLANLGIILGIISPLLVVQYGLAKYFGSKI
ncbi:MAG: HAD-IC family P-type ATPase [Patescibacteria group bacterium]